MFDELTKYKSQGHFFFNVTDRLANACNAPNNKSGVYVVYALARGKIELIYIGRSGKRLADGTISIRKAGLGGMKDRLVNGLQFDRTPRRKSWPIKMLSENIETLDIYWYVTDDKSNNDCPAVVERFLLENILKYMDDCRGGIKQING